MKVAAVSLLCQDERVFEAMLMAGTPCPFEGKIGKDAIEQWDKYDVERPDYEKYVSKLETRSRIDAELEAIRIQKEQEGLGSRNSYARTGHSGQRSTPPLRRLHRAGRE